MGYGLVSPLIISVGFASVACSLVIIWSTSSAFFRIRNSINTLKTLCVNCIGHRQETEMQRFDVNFHSEKKNLEDKSLDIGGTLAFVIH